LALAAKRLLHRQAQPQFPTWQETEGLASLLDYARRCGWQDLPAACDDDLPTTGLGCLLREARQRTPESQP
jgi:hypothetical protein